MLKSTTVKICVSFCPSVFCVISIFLCLCLDKFQYLPFGVERSPLPAPALLTTAPRLCFSLLQNFLKILSVWSAYLPCRLILPPAHCDLLQLSPSHQSCSSLFPFLSLSSSSVYILSVSVLQPCWSSVCILSHVSVLLCMWYKARTPKCMCVSCCPFHELQKN